jgi:4-amino-4-deoxychorismate lyase
MNDPLASVLVNGESAVTIPIMDRGLAYGQGVFETVRIANGKPLLWDAHLARLKLGCQRLLIPFDATAQAELVADVTVLSKDCPAAVVKVTITAGAGGRGYRMPDTLQPNRIVARSSLPAYPQAHTVEGIKVRTCDYRLPVNAALAGIKHLNRLDQVLARAEWSDIQTVEGIMLDQTGTVIEGTMTNILGCLDGTLLTPSLAQAGVAGVMRSYLVEQARLENIEVAEVEISADAFKRCDEIFVCNSVAGIWPVVAWDERRYPIGPVTRRLKARVDALFNRQ